MRQKVFELAHGGTAEVEGNFHQAFLSGLLESWFLGFWRLEGCDQGNKIHFEGDVLVHTRKVFAYASAIGGLDESDRFVLLVAALVHDICKPHARQVRDGKVTFYGHDWQAAERCPAFAKNVGMTATQAERLEWVVRHHMQAHELPKFGERKRLEKFYRSPHFPVLRALQMADAQATWLNREGSEWAPVLYHFFAEDYQRLSSAAKNETAHP